jgi:hypothetical protein
MERIVFFDDTVACAFVLGAVVPRADGFGAAPSFTETVARPASLLAACVLINEETVGTGGFLGASRVRAFAPGVVDDRIVLLVGLNPLVLGGATSLAVPSLRFVESWLDLAEVDAVNPGTVPTLAIAADFSFITAWARAA